MLPRKTYTKRFLKVLQIYSSISSYFWVSPWKITVPVTAILIDNYFKLYLDNLKIRDA